MAKGMNHEQSGSQFLQSGVGVEKVGWQNVISAANVPSRFFFPDL
jgi:hypothetical protein